MDDTRGKGCAPSNDRFERAIGGVWAAYQYLWSQQASCLPKARRLCGRQAMGRWWSMGLLLALLLAACTNPLAAVDPLTPQPLAPAAATPRPIPTLFPTITLPSAERPASSIGSGTETPDSGWLAGSPGVELRRLRIVAGAQSGSVIVVRLDPAVVRLRVAYDPQQPRSLRAWFKQQRPLLAVNGAFFTPEYQATALVISDGTASGTSYQGFGGMLAVAPDNAVSVRPLRDQPYDPNEPLQQALQSFPMLVFPGGSPAELADDGARARRTVIAQDRSGRLLLLVCPGSSFTLQGLAEWLLSSDLEIERALNLDGGASTGLYLDAGQLHEQIDPFDLLPMVLIVEARRE